MDWDQQTYMPRRGGNARAAQSSILSRIAHEMTTSESMKSAISGAKSSVAPNSDDEAIVRITERSYQLATKVPATLVEEKGRVSGEAHEAWIDARAKNDFKTFQPFLEKLVELTRKEADFLGFEDHPYDAVTDAYEEGATKKFWEGMFDGIRKPLISLVAGVKASPYQADDSWLYGDWPEAKQHEFGNMLVQALGFDFSRGRQDTAAHPFCTNFSVNDVRLTTRFKDYLPSSIMGSLHEAGHGLYEQGSPEAWDRLPLAGGVSLGVHESQSRTWENIIGRSRAFWHHFHPKLAAAFPEVGKHDFETWYRCLNKVVPSFIRVEADEVTYNLHIMIRFEIECAMMDGTLKVADLPDYWNAKYEEYMGITPRNDSEGCLQDVHWSSGSIGYFPTYSMGNILSYQFWSVLEKDLGDVNTLMEQGSFGPILNWLTKNIYAKGSKYRPADLVKQVTGGGLDPKPYLESLHAKYADIYGLVVMA